MCATMASCGEGREDQSPTATPIRDCKALAASGQVWTGQVVPVKPSMQVSPAYKNLIWSQTPHSLVKNSRLNLCYLILPKSDIYIFTA
jgi:hypothetical protein